MIMPQSPDGAGVRAGARVRDRLVPFRRARSEATLEQMTCRLAVRMNVRPSEAAAYLARLSRDSGIDLLAVARSLDGGPSLVPEGAGADPS